MHRIILTLAILLAPAVAQATCPAVSTDCPSPTYNNLTTSGLLTAPNVAITGGTITGVSGIANNGSALALSSANPTPPFNIYNSITGTWPSGNPILNKIEVTSDTARGDTFNDAPGALETNYSWGGTPGTPAGSGGRYALRAYTGVGTLLPSSTSGVNWPYAVTAEFKGTIFGNMGGASHASPWGSNNVLNPVATLASGATFIGINSGAEYDTGAYYGSDAAVQEGAEFDRMSFDWGNIGYGAQPYGVGDSRSGRYGIRLLTAAPACDLTSAASALASCGHQLPSFTQAITFSTDLFDQYSTLFGFQYVVNQNTNSCTDCGSGSSGSPPHGGAAITAAIRRPPLIGSIMDASMMNIANNAWFSNGFQVTGTGATNIGPASIVPTNTTTGLTIDISGKYVSAVAISGSWGPKAVGEQVFDQYGGIYQVATVDGSGNVTGWSIVKAGYTQAGSPCTTGCYVYGSGPPALIALTWTTPTVLNLNPTGASVTLPQGVTVTAVNGLQSTSGFKAAASSFVAASSGTGYYMTDTSGHHPFFGGQADAVQLLGADNTGALSTVFSYAGNVSGTQPFRILKPLQVESYINHGGTGAGTPTSCGTSPAIISGSTDVSGIASVGTGTVTSCTIPFGVTHSIVPTCVANAHIAGAPQLVSVTAETATSFTVQSSANMASAAIRYHCL